MKTKTDKIEIRAKAQKKLRYFRHVVGRHPETDHYSITLSTVAEDLKKSGEFTVAFSDGSCDLALLEKKRLIRLLILHVASIIVPSNTGRGGSIKKRDELRKKHPDYLVKTIPTRGDATPYISIPLNMVKIYRGILNDD